MIKKLSTTLAACCLVLALTATRPSHDPAEPMGADKYAADRATILSMVDTFFEALEVQDNDTIRSLLHEGAVTASLRWDAEGNPIMRQRPEAAIPPAEDRWIERYWNPVVLVEGNIAMFWAPYDFYINTRFNHCGIDVFNFLKVNGEWKIINSTYTVVQDGSCDMHPNGPPSLD